MWDVIGERRIEGMPMILGIMGTYETWGEANEVATSWNIRNGHFANYYVKKGEDT